MSAQFSAVELERCDANRCLLSRAGTVKSFGCTATITSDELVGTVDDHLRRIGACEMQPPDVILLPNRERVRGKWVPPSTVVPIIHVLFQDDQLGTGHGLCAVQSAQEGVGRRAIGTAFRSKEFDQNGTRSCRGSKVLLSAEDY